MPPFGRSLPPRAATSAPPRGFQWRWVALGALSLVAALGALAAIWLLARPLALLLAAVVIAQALAPAVDWLTRWMPRAAAIGLVYLVVLAVIGSIAALIVPPLIEQTRTLLASGPEQLERLERWIERNERLDLDSIVDALQSEAGRLGAMLVALPLGLITSVAEMVLILTLSAYWLIAQPALRSFALSFFPAERREQAGDILLEVGRTMGGYVRGTLIGALIIAVMTFAGLSLIGLEYALVLALIAGMGELIPVVGPFIAGVPAVAIALLDSPTRALIVLGFYVAVQQVESNLLIPNIMRKQSDIPPLLVVFAIFAGGTVGGLLGALVAIPLTGALRVLVLRIVAPAVRNWTGAAAAGGG